MRTSQSAECLHTLWGPFSAMFKVTTNEFGQDITQLNCYEGILLTGN